MSARRAIALTWDAPHVRSCASVRGSMNTVLLALTPCLLLGAYNTGLQLNLAGAAAGAGRDGLLARLGAGRDPGSALDCLLLGALEFVPLLAVTLLAGALWEQVFARVRRRPRAPGLAVTACLLTALLPPGLALWQAALGASVAIVLGREVFGGTGRNVFNPAVVGLAFLTFAYPAELAPDALPGAPTALQIALARGADGLAERGVGWLDAFVGLVPGGLACTSALGALLGAALLVARRVASWRVMLGVLLGAAAGAALLPGPPAHWQLVLGSLAFGAVFLATDPVTSPVTDAGRWLYGALIGALVVLIRVGNPLQVEGVLLAVLLGNAAAPLADHAVAWLHTARRRRRHARG